MAKFLEQEGLLPKGTYQELKANKELRIENQYYLRNKIVEINRDELTEFFLEIKEVVGKLGKEEIIRIRKKLNNQFQT